MWKLVDSPSTACTTRHAWAALWLGWGDQPGGVPSGGYTWHDLGTDRGRVATKVTVKMGPQAPLLPRSALAGLSRCLCIPSLLGSKEFLIGLVSAEANPCGPFPSFVGTADAQDPGAPQS